MRLTRALMLAVLACLATAATPAFAIDNCLSQCPDPEPEPDPVVAPFASLSGPASAVRTVDTVTFDASGSNGGEDADGTPMPITSVEWDLDGVSGYESNTGTTLTKQVAYLKGFALGELTVRVRISSDTGSTIKSRKISIVNRAPDVSLSVSDATPVTGQPITFTGTGTDHDSDGGVLPAWEFNGMWCSLVSGNCPGETYTRSYATPGTYTQKFGGEDVNGAFTETSKTVVVRVAPTASLSVPAKALNGESVELDASASTGSGPRKYKWDVDGNAANGFEVDGGTNPKLARSFATRGDHPVRVKVLDVEGVAAESATKTVTTHAAPTAAFSYAPADPVAGDTVAFTSQSTDDGAIVVTAWDLDGNAANGFELAQKDDATRTFAQAGQYVVRLKVSDDQGASTIVEKTITVRAKQADPGTKTDTKNDTPIQTGGGTTPNPGSASTPQPGAGSSGAAPQAQGPAIVAPVAQPRQALVRKAVRKARRCAAPKGRKARGKKARKCAAKKRPRRAKKRR